MVTPLGVVTCDDIVGRYIFDFVTYINLRQT